MAHSVLQDISVLPVATFQSVIACAAIQRIVAGVGQ